MASPRTSRNRLLVLSASAGNGHIAAARSVVDALREHHADVEVRHEDLFDHVIHPLRLIGNRGYAACVDHAPWLWRLVYSSSDSGPPVRFPRAVRSIASRLLDLVARWRPDRILTTYWTGGLLSPWIEEAVGRRVPTSVVVTDAVLHRVWLDPVIDRYYVADEELRGRFLERGVPEARVHATGIPAHSRFRPADRGAARDVLGMSGSRPWILLVAGPRSMRELATPVRRVLEAVPDLGVAILTARDGSLRRRLERVSGVGGRLLVGGLVPDLERWIAAADLVVSKGGGLITAEATAVGAPLLVHRPIPGQEEANAVRLQAAGAARVIGDLDDFTGMLRSLLSPGNGEGLAAMREAAGRIGRPDAAAAIAASEAELLRVCAP